MLRAYAATAFFPPGPQKIRRPKAGNLPPFVILKFGGLAETTSPKSFSCHATPQGQSLSQWWHRFFPAGYLALRAADAHHSQTVTEIDGGSFRARGRYEPLADINLQYHAGTDLAKHQRISAASQATDWYVLDLPFSAEKTRDKGRPKQDLVPAQR